MKAKKILITGAAGYIGSITTQCLLKKGLKIVAVDNFSSGYRECLDILQEEFGKSNLEIYNLDLIEDLSQAFHKKNVDLVIHFAASCDVSESIKNPKKYYKNNVLATESLIKHMKKYNVRNIIFSSTCAVYGVPKYNPIDENHEINPNTPYGSTKRKAEELIILEGRQKKINYIIFRYFNVTGASEKGKFGDSKKPSTLLIQNIIRGILKIAPFYITSKQVNTPDGTPIRDFINVIDLVDAHLKGIHYLSGGGKNEIINLGTGDGSSILEILKIAEKVLKKKIKILNSRELRIGESAITISSIKKAKKVLNWKPKRTIEDSILSLVDWYKGHPKGWKY